MLYNSLPIDKSEIPQEELNIDIKLRSNLFSWNGQFSPQFVETLLKKYATKGDVVLDPFAGSGTTLCECARQGLKALGIELNVSAYYISKIYELCELPIKKRQNLIQSIDYILSTINNNDILSFLKKNVDNTKDLNGKNIFSLIIILLDLCNNNVSMELLQQKWFKLKNIILDLPITTEEISVQLGNAKQLNSIKNNSVDLLITSPPYINVFNYHQKYRRSVEALGYNVLNIAKGEIGSNRKNRSNRLLTIIQYCIDMALSMQEASRVCKERARMIYIVGRESKVLGLSFCNSEIIYLLATQIFGFNILLRQERFFKNRYGQNIYEDILHFSNIKQQELNKEQIIIKAKNIALHVLHEKYGNTDNDKITLIEEAIKKIDKITESEVCFA